MMIEAAQRKLNWTIALTCQLLGHISNISWCNWVFRRFEGISQHKPI